MNVFITGGSRGIGRAIVLKLVLENCGCAFTYVNNKKAADETIKKANEINPKVQVSAYRMDAKDPGMVKKTVDCVINDFENIDGVVNNAAIVRNNAAVLMSNEEWEEVIATNLSGPFYVTRSFLMHFISNKHGRIVNISSLAEQGSSGQANYSASKAGLLGLTKTIAKKYSAKSICCNSITVGYVKTDMTKDHLSDELHKFWLLHCPLKKAGSVEDVANLVYFLLLKESSSINGENIRVTGGLTYAP